MDTKKTKDEIEAAEKRLQEIELNELNNDINEFLRLREETNENNFIDLMKSINGGPVDSLTDAFISKTENKKDNFNIDPNLLSTDYKFLIDEGVIILDYTTFVISMNNANINDLYTNSIAKYKLMRYIFLVNKLIKNKEWYTKAVESIGKTKSDCSPDMKNTDFEENFNKLHYGEG